MCFKKRSLNRYYESDITRFIADLKHKNAHLEQQQQEGHALLWNKAPIDLDAHEREKVASLPQPAYVYQTRL